MRGVEKRERMTNHWNERRLMILCCCSFIAIAIFFWRTNICLRSTVIELTQRFVKNRSCHGRFFKTPNLLPNNHFFQKCLKRWQVTRAYSRFVHEWNQIVRIEVLSFRLLTIIPSFLELKLSPRSLYSFIPNLFTYRLFILWEQRSMGF